MRIEGRRYRDEWLPNFYPSRKFGDRLVKISRTGKTILLSDDEDAQINEFFMNSELFERLERTGHVITSANASKVFDDLATWMRGTYDGPGLHIVVPTRRCNLNCTYCHMNPRPVEASKDEHDLQPETIPYIARFIMSSPRHRLCVEFQGGEPFLNFPAIVQTIEEVKRLNAAMGKSINFTIVSNLMVANDEQLAYCHENKVGISYSLNGPEPIHDLIRITRKGAGSHKTVIRKIEHITKRFPGLLDRYPLCVVTGDNMSQTMEMVEYYYQLGFRSIGLIPLKNLGNAVGRVHFDMKEFIPHYLEMLDYIFDKNKTSEENYTERLVHVALQKILGASNPLFVDWRNPIGYVSNCLVFDADGEILPVDEARSLRDVFKLGNVRDVTYEDLIRKRSSFETVNLSIRDRHPVCRECTYNPYCGVSPVLHYSRTGKLEPEPHVSHECLFILALFDWVFKKIIDDPVNLLKMVPDYRVALEKCLAAESATEASVAAH
jgi:radical SAM protein with 4Fe4S-binding SPASM domain